MESPGIGNSVVIDGFEYPFDRCFDHQPVRRQWLGNSVANAGVAACRRKNFTGNVAACMSARRKKIWMNSDVTRSPLEQAREPFSNVWMFYLKKGWFDQREAAAFTDAPRCFTHVFIGFRATATVTDYQYARHTRPRLFFHAATPFS